MRFVSRISAILALTAMALPAAGADTSWLPPDRTYVAQVLTKDTGADASALSTLDAHVTQRRKALASDANAIDNLEEWAAEQRRRLAPGETAWVLNDPALPFTVVMVGSGERIHSLRVGIALVNSNQRENEAAFARLSDLYAVLYPSWADARIWLFGSFQNAWNKSVVAAQTPPDDPDDLFVRKTVDGVTTSTIGVPPDLVGYTVTVRERCIPVHAHGNPYANLVC